MGRMEMNRMQETSAFDALRAPLAILGFVLVAVGAGMLLYVAMLVYNVLNDPSTVPLVDFLLKNIKAGDLAFSGWMQDAVDPSRNIKFEIHWSETVRTVSFLFLGVIIFSALATVMNFLISGGVNLVKLAANPQDSMKTKQ